jgi:hypothetical protein
MDGSLAPEILREPRLAATGRPGRNAGGRGSGHAANSGRVVTTIAPAVHRWQAGVPGIRTHRGVESTMESFEPALSASRQRVLRAVLFPRLVTAPPGSESQVASAVRGERSPPGTTVELGPA